MLVKEIISKQNQAPARPFLYFWSLGMIRSVEIVDVEDNLRGRDIKGIGVNKYYVRVGDKVVRVHVTTDIAETIRNKTTQEKKEYLLNAIAMLRPYLFKDDFLKKQAVQVVEILNEYNAFELVEELKSYDYIIPVFLLNNILYVLYGVFFEDNRMRITTYAGIGNTYIKTREVTKTFEEFYDAITKMSVIIFRKHKKMINLLRDKEIRGICPITPLKALFDVKPYTRIVDNYHPFPFELEEQRYLPAFVFPDTLSRSVYEIISKYRSIEELLEVASSFAERLERMNKDEIREIALAVFQEDVKDDVKEMLKIFFKAGGVK